MNIYLPLFPCSQCNTPLAITSEIFIEYFYGGNNKCPHNLLQLRLVFLGRKNSFEVNRINFLLPRENEKGRLCW